jgi:hypothetical protein
MKTERQPGAGASDVAIAAINIGPREQLKRRVMGIVFLIISAGFAFLMIAYDVPRAFRLVIFFPLWMAGLGLFQAREKT